MKKILNQFAYDCMFPKQTSEKVRSILLGFLVASCVLFAACSSPTDANGLPIVYPVVTSRDAGFQINGKKVTKVIIQNSQYSSDTHYMYMISFVPIEAHSSVNVPSQGKGHAGEFITNVEIPQL